MLLANPEIPSSHLRSRKRAGDWRCMGCFAHNYTRNNMCYNCHIEKCGNSIELCPVKEPTVDTALKELSDKNVVAPVTPSQKKQKTSPKDDEDVGQLSGDEILKDSGVHKDVSEHEKQSMSLALVAGEVFTENAFGLARAEAEAHSYVVRRMEAGMVHFRAGESRIKARLEVVSSHLRSARGKQGSLGRRVSFFQERIDKFDSRHVNPVSPGSRCLQTGFSRGDSAERDEKESRRCHYYRKRIE